MRRFVAVDTGKFATKVAFYDEKKANHLKRNKKNRYKLFVLFLFV